MSNFEQFSLSPAPSPVSIATKQLAEASQHFQVALAESKRLWISDFDQYLKHRSEVMKLLSMECKAKQVVLKMRIEEESAQVGDHQEPVRNLC
jgi:predicted solute-binding protein